jgi:micrococcal nuclease
MYEYKVEKILKVIDGDTVDVLVDLGFHTYLEKRVRLSGINAPEIRTRDKAEKAKGKLAKKKLQELLNAEDIICEQGREGLILRSYGAGKFGRVIGDILKDNVNLGQLLLQQGLVKKYE